jgi:hypothetical protein
MTHPKRGMQSLCNQNAHRKLTEQFYGKMFTKNAPQNRGAQFARACAVEFTWTRLKGNFNSKKYKEISGESIPLTPLVSPCLPTYVCLCWMVCPPSRSLVSPCPPLSPLVSHCLPICGETTGDKRRQDPDKADAQHRHPCGETMGEKG